jgi:hypothetical protein
MDHSATTARPSAFHAGSPRPLRSRAPLTALTPGEVEADDAAPEPIGDAGDEPPPARSLPAHAADPLSLPLAFLGGALIALLTILVPLATVVADRSRGLSEGSTPERRESGSPAGAPTGADPFGRAP